MAENETGREVLALQPSRPQFLSRVAPDAAFVSQLIAERDHLAPQREHRRAPVDIAVGAYDTGSRIAIRRMPPGYRKNVDA
jgi:hypothetical protein